MKKNHSTNASGCQQTSFTNGGEVQVARRAPCASHTAEPAGGIAFKSAPNHKVLLTNQPYGKYWTVSHIASAMRHVLLKIWSTEIY